MLEDKKTKLSAPKVKPIRKQCSSFSWDNLPLSKQTMTNPVPQAEAVYKLAETLKFFLEEEADGLEPSQKESGEFILDFLSCWENLNENMKWCCYKKLVVFLNEYAKNWKVYKLLDIPDSSTVSGQHCHRRGPQKDGSDASSFWQRSSAIPRRISVTRRSSVKN
jgi:hypothetical protein